MGFCHYLSDFEKGLYVYGVQYGNMQISFQSIPFGGHTEVLLVGKIKVMGGKSWRYSATFKERGDADSFASLLRRSYYDKPTKVIKEMGVESQNKKGYVYRVWVRV